MKDKGLKGGLLTVLVLGSVVYAIVAAINRWEPALTIIQTQALWNGGTYYVKFTFLCTWLAVLTPPLALAGLLSAVVGLFAARPLPPVDAEDPSRWAVLHQRSPRAGMVPSLIAVVLGGAFLFEAFVDPAALAPAGFVSSLGLLAAPLALLLGGAIALDALVPPQWHWGMIDSLDVQPGQRNAPPQFLMRSGGKSWNVPEALFNRLRVGLRIGVQHGTVINRLHQLRVQAVGLR